MSQKPKKTLLTCLCASYSHTPLALYALRAYCGELADTIFIESFTINQPDELILRCLYEHKPDILGFSCYVWNIEKTVRIAAAVRLLLPQVTIVFGGPEMAAEYEPYLQNGTADIVIPGEGEKPLLALLKGEDIASIEGVACVSALPFAYPSLAGLENKALYYEASRGCPFGCTYCTSGGQPLRLKPLDTVFGELSVFIDARVMRVKFTDRTFNAREDFALSIWRFLMEQDNGTSNFHFEIAADLLSEKALALLGRARVGLFQFEIGVQSTNPQALAAVNRKTDTKRLCENVKRLRGYNNIHVHVDLIAGLPGEDLLSFGASFDQVYALRPHHLQLGFLKLLKGTPLRAQAASLGLVYNPHPPYEILSTPQLSYDHISLLKSVAHMVQVFYSSGKFVYTLDYLLQAMDTSAFELYKGLAAFWRREELAGQPHAKMRVYQALFDFARAHVGHDAILKDLLRFDLLLNENEKSVPDWMLTGRHRCQFEADILAWVNRPQKPMPMRKHTLAFDYPVAGRQNILTAMARVRENCNQIMV